MNATPDTSSKPEFYIVNTCPCSTIYPSLPMSAINAMVIANQSSWDEEYQALMKQVHALSLMPSDPKCAMAMFEAGGFIRQPSIRDYISAEEVINHMNSICADGQTAIIRIRNSLCFIAIVPSGFSKFRPENYADTACHAYGFPCNLRCSVSDIWVRWADGQDHSPKKRRKGRHAPGKPRKLPENHLAFEYVQKNPQGNRIGDCVIRAMASVLDTSWDEAMDKLTAVANPGDFTINRQDVYGLLLEKEGFEKRAPLRRFGKTLTGEEFCREMSLIFHQGERIFAHVGSSHAAAIVPFREDGVTRYKIVDSWDSSSRKIDEYWVKKPSGQDRKQKAEDLMPVNSYIIHPLYGRGKIQSHHQSGWTAVNFPEGFHVLSTKWIAGNCTIEPLMAG